jgi:hypothetical protein
MDRAYVLGAPRFVSRAAHERIHVPLEEWEASYDVYEESGWGNVEWVAARRSREYRSIVRALRDLDLPFAIFTPPDPAALFGQPGGSEVRRLLRESRLLHAPDALARAHVSYPRDLMHVVRDVWLIQERDRACFADPPDASARFSALGEGGRVLHAGNVLLHPDAILVDGETRRADFEVPGVTCRPMPPPWLGSCDRGGLVLGDLRPADHLDRTGCLLADDRGGVHLIVNHGLRVRGEPSPAEPRLLSRRATDRILRERLSGTAVQVHRAPPSPVPQILSVIQDDTGRILMSGGDDDTKAFVEGITSRPVHTTDVPIRAYPVFSLAGLRCLVGETPRTFFEASVTRA